MLPPGKRLDGGTTSARALGLGDPPWALGLRGALRKSSEGEEDASNQASVATAADWWHLRRGSVHGDSCVNVMKSEHLANLAEDSERAEGHRSVRQVVTDSPDPAETTTSTG